MSIDLNYLKSELEQLKKEFEVEKNEIEDRVKRDVHEFEETHHLNESIDRDSKIIREYRELKMRIYARELEPKEELLISVKKKIDEIEKIYSSD